MQTHEGEFCTDFEHNKPAHWALQGCLLWASWSRSFFGLTNLGLPQAQPAPQR
jgi:hypothetical protein